MKKISFIIFLGIILFTSVSFSCIAGDYRPVISGNYEEGQRLYESEEGVGDDYIFRESWLKFKQKLSPKSYYYFKVLYHENDFLKEDQYDSYTFDFIANYTYQINNPVRLKTELRLRDKKYPSSETKNYYFLGTNLELSIRLKDLDKIQCRMNLQQEIYPLTIKDNFLMGFALSWEKELWQGFSLHSQYKFSGQNYFDEQVISDKLRHSISIGFEYQL
ncbi:hypothetical protein BBF96_10865 [Anoxybacter fermentans]|uniref:Outer membrane protein beta-barrel domain-containing protein n=1 Tax=Anoxybacter fermentans TaxID=1323375 RepID=A0A3S9SZR6_9FIRM|nr:hypothetical protein [Anoxybacter fermentans]AZR73843.1 hypothetical protein BBF96_10865 [Anoxybacter fermentans]